MATGKRISVKLPAQLGRFAEKAVGEGRYESLDEVVRDGIRLLMDRERGRAAAIRALRKKIEEGIKATDAGEVVDAQRFFAELAPRRRRSRQAG